MNFALQSCILLVLFIGAHSQLTCNKCSSSRTGKGDCGTEQKCSNVQTRCLAIRSGANQVRNTYETRCATADECSYHGKEQLCAAGGEDCEAKCCDSSKCDPFLKQQAQIIKTGGRVFTCYQCSRESLDSCTSTDQICDDDQDACASFLMEGGNHDKVYTKRCARKDECGQSELDRLCALEKDQSNRKECRASCCFDEMCNQASLKTIPLLVIAGAVLLAILALN